MATVETYAQPAKLYRFRPLAGPALDRELKAILGSYVFCPSYEELNDPMEGVHTESAVLREAKSYKVTVAEVSSAKALLGIASFSEALNSEPMWAHYAAEFQGMCVAYNFRKLLDELSDEHAFVRMTYNEKAPVISSERKTADQRARMVLSTKAVRWAPEREWRLLRPSRGPANYQSKNCVTGIYLGARISDQHRNAVSVVADRLKIPLWSMAIDKYELSFGRLLSVPTK
jgi:hypothetical protein